MQENNINRTSKKMPIFCLKFYKNFILQIAQVLLQNLISETNPGDCTEKKTPGFLIHLKISVVLYFDQTFWL